MCRNHLLVRIQIMSLFSAPSNRQINTGLTVLRIIAGTIFVAHGWQKLFVFGLDGVTGGFAQLGIPMPELLGPLVAFLELFGGLALIAGLLTRLAAAGLAFNMLVATLQVHLKNGFFNPTGIEFTLSLLGSSIFLALSGAGAWSMDALIGRKTKVTVHEEQKSKIRRAA